MPVYNNEKYFPNAVNSVLNQTNPDWELIIVDDGSTDNTPQLADEFASKDNRIKVIHQQNQWIYASMNNGIKKATGEYVLVFNSDDLLGDESVQKIYEVSILDNAELIIFNMRKCFYDEYEGEAQREVVRLPQIENSFSIKDKNEIIRLFPILYKKCFLSRQCVYKKSIYKNHIYHTNNILGDQIFNLEIAYKLKSIAGTSYLVYKYLIYNNETNASYRKYYSNLHEAFNIQLFSYCNLMNKWKCDSLSDFEYVSFQRLSRLSSEINAFNYSTCDLTVESSLEKLFTELSDNVVYNCAVQIDDVFQYQRRILNGLDRLFKKRIPDKSCKYYFFYEMISCFHKKDKKSEDIELIRQAVNNPLNPHRIGECFYLYYTIGDNKDVQG